jgi:hypothetical protein
MIPLLRITKTAERLSSEYTGITPNMSLKVTKRECYNIAQILKESQLF